MDIILIDKGRVLDYPYAFCLVKIELCNLPEDLQFRLKEQFETLYN